MKRLIAVTLGAIATCLLVSLAHAADIIPQRVATADKLKLQELLDRHGSIILDPDADYRSAGITSLKVSTGQRIIGGWNTRVPQIDVVGGASNVFISGVRGGAPATVDVVFSGGAENNDVQIIGGSGGATTNIRVRIAAGARVNRLRLSEYGGLEVLQAESGYVRDSVFTGLLGYWEGPQIFWRGNLAEPSHGNAFLGIASITPQRGSTWNQAGDLWLVAWDCESWNSTGKGSRDCFVVDGATSVVSIGLSGGTAYAATGGVLARFRNVGSLVAWFNRGKGSPLASSDIAFDAVGTSVLVQSERGTREAFQNDPGSAARIRIMQPLQDPEINSFNGVPLDGGSHAAVLEAAYLSTPRKATSAKPQLREMGDRLGAGWREGLSERPDSSAILQAQIDREGIVRLPAGVYYLDKPLKVGSSRRVEGFLGAGRDDVYLVAKGAFPVIEGRGGFSYRNAGESPLTIVLSDLTIYGGSYGLSFSAEAGNAGDGAQIAWSTFSNLKFLKQTRAGVHAAGILGFDSNLWYRVDFADMPVAFRGEGKGAAGGMTYADKQHFIDCQYRNIRDAVWYWNADRPSGGQIWQDNYFHRVGGISRTRAASNLLWINSVMEDVVGPVGIDITDSGRTATYFFYLVDCLVKGTGPQVFADTLSFGNGVLYIDSEFRQRGGSIVGASRPQTLFAWNSSITGSASVGNVTEGVLVNSRMGEFSRTLEYVRNGKITAVVERPAAPYTQVLGQ